MDALPESFSIREAFNILGWQGSRKGLARHLEAQGFAKSAWYDDRSRDTRIMWHRPVIASSGPAIQAEDDRWECGSDVLIAKLALRLVERNAIASVDAFRWLESEIVAAGPRFCREMLARFGNEEVPF